MHIVGTDKEIKGIEMFDQINYQIYPYHINKIINYEKVNYFPLPFLILKTSKQDGG